MLLSNTWTEQWKKCFILDQWSQRARYLLLRNTPFGEQGDSREAAKDTKDAKEGKPLVLLLFHSDL